MDPEMTLTLRLTAAEHAYVVNLLRPGGPTAADHVIRQAAGQTGKTPDWPRKLLKGEILRSVRIDLYSETAAAVVAGLAEEFDRSAVDVVRWALLRDRPKQGPDDVPIPSLNFRWKEMRGPRCYYDGQLDTDDLHLAIVKLSEVKIDRLRQIVERHAHEFRSLQGAGFATIRRPSRLEVEMAFSSLAVKLNGWRRSRIALMAYEAFVAGEL